MAEDVKVIAIHLPQFHPFKENDEWWGKGFTEWTNVSKARPRFEGHYQPHLPSDLGFYDLRLEESRVAQADLAKEYSIHGFCYYHYWFNGKRLLNRPLDDMLKTKTPDFPYMLCWANENWSRRWDGLDKEVLMEQHYNSEDDREHIQFLIQNFFKDERYIRIDGKPFFAIYKPTLLPDVKATVAIWREEARKAGIGELYIGYFQSPYYFMGDPAELGLDCSIEFMPFVYVPPRIEPTTPTEKIKKVFGMGEPYDDDMIVWDYRELVTNALTKIEFKENVFPGITPGWDNTARRKKGPMLLVNATPQHYGVWLANLINKYRSKGQDFKNKIIFVNAWNEWAEGNHLEPCQKYGREYLEITKELIDDHSAEVKDKWKFEPFYHKKITVLDRACYFIYDASRIAYFFCKSVAMKIIGKSK